MAQSTIGELFEQEYGSFKRYLRARFNQINEYDAEDIIQETVYKILHKGNDALSIRNMTSYIYTALRNGAIDHIKKRQKEVLVQEFYDEPTQTAEDTLLKAEVKKVLREAIESLDEKSKFIFIETEMKGRKYNDISFLTGESVGTLLSRKSRAVKKLKKFTELYFNKEAKQ